MGLVLTKDGKEVGGIDKTGYRWIKFKGKRFSLHRLIWLAHYGTMPNEVLDHINGNRLDNRIDNLRQASLSENAQNRKPNSGAKLPMGVWHSKVTNSKKPYRANIKVQGKKIHLGTFATADEAGKAYVDAKIRLHPSWSIERLQD